MVVAIPPRGGQSSRQREAHSNCGITAARKGSLFFEQGYDTARDRSEKREEQFEDSAENPAEKLEYAAQQKVDDVAVFGHKVNVLPLPAPRESIRKKESVVLITISGKQVGNSSILIFLLICPEVVRATA